MNVSSSTGSYSMMYATRFGSFNHCGTRQFTPTILVLYCCRPSITPFHIPTQYAAHARVLARVYDKDNGTFRSLWFYSSGEESSSRRANRQLTTACASRLFRGCRQRTKERERERMRGWNRASGASTSSPSFWLAFARHIPNQWNINQRRVSLVVYRQDLSQKSKHENYDDTFHE